MIDDFEVFNRRAKPVVAQPTCTLQRKGLISLNQSAYDLLQAPAAVELLFSRSRNVIGIRAIEPTKQHAIPVRKQSKSSTWLIAGQSFASHFGISQDRARRFPVKLQDGTLLVDLNGDWTEAPSNRVPKQEQAGVTG
jgi:hypothetical protein